MDVDIQSIEYKDDGWSLIVEAEYSLNKIREYVKSSCVADRCEFLETINSATDEDVTKLCTGFGSILNDETDLDDLSTLLVVSCLIYTLEDATIGSLSTRTYLLHKVIFHSDTLCPHHLHVFVERMWDGLKIPNNTSYVMNIISLCREICIINSTGKAVAICLAWTILAEITESEFQMFRFHKFSEINTMLKEIDEDVLRYDESTQVIYILIQVIGFLVNTIVFGLNNDFIKAGFSDYFTYKKKDLEQLKEWAEHLCTFITTSVSKPGNYWDLRMSMTEYLKMNIISMLYDKIRDMD